MGHPICAPWVSLEYSQQYTLSDQPIVHIQYNLGTRREIQARGRPVSGVAKRQKGRETRVSGSKSCLNHSQVLPTSILRTGISDDARMSDILRASLPYVLPLTEAEQRRIRGSSLRSSAPITSILYKRLRRRFRVLGTKAEYLSWVGTCQVHLRLSCDIRSLS